ncbi:MAG: 2-oxoacid:ferredoxin oxidoreductase subunit gamma [Candidatus Dadabacteria bacterium]|nr:MAG: 2-oxoacid:ferredoxin oxidoreductase subunit gamma [Candidatus Dadabacteria bacterium]
MHHDVIMAGFGGQGILMIGNLLAVAGLRHGLRVTFFPAYGVEMRGGTANCTVTLSDQEIGSPVTARPLGLVAMNEPSVVKFGPRVRAGGVVVINASIVSDDAFQRDDVRAVRVRCNDLARELGDPRTASMIALGAYVTASGVVPVDAVAEALAEVLPEKAHKLIPLNRKALEVGASQAGA